MNVLLSSAGRRIGLLRCLRTALREAGSPGRLIAADASPDAPALQEADAPYIVPRATEGDLLPRLLEIARGENVGLVFPTIDTELAVWASARETFRRAGVEVVVSSAECIEIAADKRKTNEWLRAHRFPAVRQAPIEEVLDRRSDWRLPVIAKPARGSASAGLLRATSFAELEAATESPSDVIVEEIAPGVEYTVHVWVDRAGRARCAVPCRRLEVRAGEVSKGVTVKHGGPARLAASIAERLPGARGPLNVQIFLAADGSMRVIEINARFGGGYPLADRAGAKFARWSIEERLGIEPKAAFDAWQDDLAMVRFDEAFYLPGSAIRGEALRSADGAA